LERRREPEPGLGTALALLVASTAVAALMAWHWWHWPAWLRPGWWNG